MANTVQSRKQKGRKAQQEVARRILAAFPDLGERDVVSTSMGCNTEDVRLSEAAFKLFPYAVEVKAQEKLNIWGAIEQSESSDRSGTPLLVFKRNRSKMYACIDFDAFMKLVKMNRALNDNIDFLDTIVNGKVQMIVDENETIQRTINE